MNADVFFRVDGTAETGAGHVARCLVLASRLAKEGMRTHFLYVRLDAAVQAMIDRGGHRLVQLESEDGLACRREIRRSARYRALLVVDHYSIEARWEQSVRPAVERLMVIDDLADRPHDCDVIVDQAYGEDGTRYSGLVPPHCVGLFGTKYALLRPEFAALRGRPLKDLERLDLSLDVHVFLGSFDVHRHAMRLAPLIAQLEGVGRVKVAVSDAVGGEAYLRQLQVQSKGRIQWHVPGSDMGSHMATCDVAIGAPGHTTWERACLGLPAAYLAVADNQVRILERLADAGFCVYLGDARAVSDDQLVEGTQAFLADRVRLASMRKIAMAAVDGEGAGRVSRALLTSQAPS